jgi:hypothetical protein
VNVAQSPDSRRNTLNALAIINRLSTKGSFVKLELYFDDGVLRDQYKVDATLKQLKLSNDEFAKVLDATLGITVPDATKQ